MQRRNFIKSTICLGCLGFFASGCKNVFIGNDKLESDKFYYKSQEELPKKIRLEACSLCQLNCPECQTRLHEKQAPKDWLGYLKYEDFKKFVDNNKFREIELANKGEIFLNPELDEIIKYANLKGIRLTADTGVNFNDVSETTLENLVKYKFKRISISIDGATPETYSIYRRGGDFNKVINNIKKVNQFKEKYASEFPRLTWNFIVFGHNEHEMESAKKKAKELGMKIHFPRNYALEYSPIKNKKLVEKQTNVKLINSQNDLFEEKNLRKRDFFSCNLLFNTPQIDYNGDLLGCCSIQTKNLKANAFKDGLLNALNSSNMIYAKHMLTDLSTKPKNDIPCVGCMKYEILKKIGKGLPLKA